MAKTVNIEPRTDDFIRAFNLLKNNGIISDNEEVAIKLGYKSGSGLSEILGRRVNISLKRWGAFNEQYGEKIAELQTSLNESAQAGPKSEPSYSENDIFSPEQIMSILARSVARQEATANNQSETLKVLSRVLDRIESKMAQETTQAEIEKKIDALGSKLTETLVGVEFVSGRQLQKIIKSLEGLQAQKKTPSQGVRKKRDEDGHGAGKTGRRH